MDQARLGELVRRCWPEAPAGLRFRPIPTGKFNESFWVDTEDKSFVLRIAPPAGTPVLFYERDMMRQEPAIHAIVGERTNVPVARIIGYDFTRTVIDRDFLLMERLPGRAWSEVPWVDTRRVLVQLGAYLAQVHQIRGDRYGYVGPHQPMEPQSSWVDAFGIMWNKLIDDIEATGHYDQQDGAYLRKLFDRHMRLFDRPVPACLLHMDIWHQNILVDERGQVTGIVDWDRALWGDPEIEFAVLDYCGISEEAFWEGYGARRDWSQEAQLRWVFYYLYELQKYIVIRHGRNRNPQAAARYKREALAMARRLLGS